MGHASRPGLRTRVTHFSGRNTSEGWGTRPTRTPRSRDFRFASRSGATGAVNAATDRFARQRVVVGVRWGEVGVAEVGVDLASEVGSHVVADAAGAWRGFTHPAQSLRALGSPRFTSPHRLPFHARASDHMPCSSGEGATCTLGARRPTGRCLTVGCLNMPGPAGGTGRDGVKRNRSKSRIEAFHETTQGVTECNTLLQKDLRLKSCPRNSAQLAPK